MSASISIGEASQMQAKAIIRSRLTFLEGDPCFHTIPDHLVAQMAENCRRFNTEVPGCASSRWKFPQTTTKDCEGQYSPFVISNSNTVLRAARYLYGPDRQVTVVQPETSAHASIQYARIIVYRNPRRIVLEDDGTVLHRLKYQVWESSWPGAVCTSDTAAEIVEKATDRSVPDPSNSQNQIRSVLGHQAQVQTFDPNLKPDMPDTESGNDTVHREACQLNLKPSKVRSSVVPRATRFSVKDFFEGRPGTSFDMRPTERSNISDPLTRGLSKSPSSEILALDESLISLYGSKTSPELIIPRLTKEHNVCQTLANPRSTIQQSDTSMPASSPQGLITLLFKKGPQDSRPRSIGLQECNTPQKLFANLFAHKGATRDILVLEAFAEGMSESMFLMRDSQADFDELLTTVISVSQGRDEAVEIVITGVKLDE